MEAKRFIGSDMARLYDRIRAQFGSGAVIIGTRTLARPGAPPLVEIIAGPARSGDDPGIALDVQWSLLGGALSRLEGERGPATVADLEELASREPGPHPGPDEDPASAPEWLRGFVTQAPPAPVSPATGRIVSPEPWPETVGPPSTGWTRTPRPIFARRPGNGVQESGIETLDGLASRLLARGFSEAAVLAVTTLAPFERDPARALATALDALTATYPADDETAVLTVEGAPGSGRTTALIRMAIDCADSGRAALLVAADHTRIAAREQVHSYAEALGIPVEDGFDDSDLARIVGAASPGTCIFADVPAGDPGPVASGGAAHLRFVALPAHWQQPALSRALASLPPSFAGSVVTFADLALDLAPVISTVLDLRTGIAFFSSGRDVSTGVTAADPITLASGIFAATTGEATNGTARATA